MNNICKNYCCKNKANSSYIKWILEVLGPVILGSKPVEILNISHKDNMKDVKLKKVEDFFSNCVKVSYRVISTYDGGIRMLFINNEALNEVFQNKKCVNFLKFLGYPSYTNLEEYINILVEKLHSDEFPHEIGIFLGYPLKDVVGFMGYGKYKLCKTKYWKVYGDPSISDEVYNKFLEDRNKMRNLLQTNSLEDLMEVV